MTNLPLEFDTAPTPYTRRDWMRAGSVAALHLAVACVNIFWFGFTMRVAAPWGAWDWFWQTLPLYHLRTDLWNSLWFLHAQPPLFNLLGGLLAPLYPYHLEALLALNVGLGSVLAGLVYLLAAHFTPRRNVAWVWASLISLNPALFLYEAYILYALLTAFWVVLTAACVLWHRRTQSDWALYAFVLTLNLLVLTRSAYHLVMLAVALGMVWLWAAPATRWRTVLVCAALCSVSVGWYAKNAVVFGFFGASSWSGSSLWKIASSPYEATTLTALAEAGVIDRMVVENQVFLVPSVYAPYGYQQRSAVAVLARDDYNNLNYPAISAAYGRNALALIQHNPVAYLQAVVTAFGYYCLPSSSYSHLYVNLQNVFDPTHPAWRTVQVLETLLTAVLLPSALGVYLMVLMRYGAAHGWQVVRAARALDSVALWCFFIITYSVVTTSMLEIGENNRFKFDVEPLIGLFIPFVLIRLRAGWKVWTR